MGCGRNKLGNWLLQNFDESYIIRSGKSIKDVAPTGAPPGTLQVLVHLNSIAKYMRSSLQESCKRHGTQLLDCLKYLIP